MSIVIFHTFFKISDLQTHKQTKSSYDFIIINIVVKFVILFIHEKYLLLLKN